MNKFDKISAAIQGNNEGEIPYSFWSHFPGIDMDPSTLAEKTFEFYETYDIDFVKTAPNGMFSIEDFGCVCDYSEISRGGVAKVTQYSVLCQDDWEKIKPIDCGKGALQRELRSLDLLMKKMRDKAPVVVTVFSPLTTAAKLSNGKVFEHINSTDSWRVHAALKSIAESTSDFLEKAIELGAAGVFFASQACTYDSLKETQYREYGVPYDLLSLQGASKGWFNTIHMHGDNIMFNALKDYPTNVLNWHIVETEPTISEARRVSGKCFMGGLNRNDITRGNKENIAKQIREVFAEPSVGKQIITPGCVIRYPLNADVLRFVKKEIDTMNTARK